jgi:enoyl-CoA hydratase/carnithine racemase
VEYQAIRHEVTRGVATLTLDRPEALNAWNGRMAAELAAALRSCDEDDDVRAVVLTGAGRAFCAGADLSGGGDAFQGEAGGGRPFYPFQVRKPVIAAINGHAIGVGITYPMLCDIRYVAEDAKIQFAFVRRGVIPELASHTLVARAVGLSNAADLLLSGRMLRGREAAELGLATQALPADEVLPAALEKARSFADTAPVSVAISKRLLWEGMGLSAPEMMRREFPAFNWVSGQPDAREGVLSFLEKRPPEWKLRPSRDLPEEF